MDDMDADLFSSKKKPSSAPVQRTDSKTTDPPQAGDKSRTTGALLRTAEVINTRFDSQTTGFQMCHVSLTEDTGPEEKKPSSAPASTARAYKKFSFLGKCKTTTSALDCI